MSIPDEWNPAKLRGVDERYDEMAEMRAKCPVAGTHIKGGMWTVLSYKHLTEVASDPAIFSNGLAPRFGRKLPPLEVDPPEHTVFRHILKRFWTPPRIRAMEPEVRAAAVQLIEPLVAAGQGDLARQIAYPLPVMALCTLLGVDPGYRDQIKDWAETSLNAEAEDADERAAAHQAHENLLAHARAMVCDRKASPRDPEVDIASALLAERVEGAALDEELVAGVLRILISAGHNSTTNAMGNTLLYLAQSSEAQDQLRAEPNRIPTAVEEILRWQSPVQELPRWAKEDVEVNGRKIGAGERVAMLWGSGNRDPEAFTDPDRCILDRKPNRHLAFGHGIHTCLGAPMARMELKVVVEELLARTASFRVAGAVERKPYHHMGVSRLPARIEPNTARVNSGVEP